MQKLKNFFWVWKELFEMIFRLYKFLWKHIKKNIIIIIFFNVILYTIFNLLWKWIQWIIVNTITSYINWIYIENDFLVIIFILLILSLIIPDLLSIILIYYARISHRKIDEIVNIEFSSKKASLDLEQIENPQIDALLRRVSENLWRIRWFFSDSYVIFRSLFMILAVLISMIFIKPIISLIIIIFTTPELIVWMKSWKTVWTIDALSWSIKRKYNTLRNYIWWQKSIIDIKLSWNIKYFIDKLYQIITPFLKEQQANDLNRAKKMSIAVIFSKIWILIAVLILINDVLNKNIQIWTFLFAFALIWTLQWSISDFFQISAQGYENSLYIKDFFNLLNLKKSMKYSDNPIFLKPWITPKIELKNVSFTYPDKDKEILHKFNLTINPWEKIAVVWVNWAGKSTFVKLLTRFYDVSSWEILIDWNNIKDLDINSWWSSVWYMPQDATNYTFEVRESIAMSDTSQKIDMKKVEKSAELSLASEFIKDFKEWFQQQLWKHFDDGEWLSWGQWQRMNLARIFYKEPQVYILDEPTSAMDAEAEAKIFENLANLPKDKTVIFISHRFSTIRQADRICLIEDGKIAELGTHEELINNNSTYKRLFELQAKWYE